MNEITATVSGSFHRHMPQIYEAVGALIDAGIKVLSPADPRIVDEFQDFLFVESDRSRSIRLVQERHLRCIQASTFLWLVCPDGYVGASAAMEIGFAAACGTPIYSAIRPNDTTLRRFVRVAPGPQLPAADIGPHHNCGNISILIDPVASTAELHKALDQLCSILISRHGDGARAERCWDAAKSSIAR